MSWITDVDLTLWKEGKHIDSYTRLGAHPQQNGTWFAVWAPRADKISVLGEFNDWNPETNPLSHVGQGLWACFVEKARTGHHYKYRITSGRYVVDKTDPFAFAMEPPSRHGSAIAGLASIVTDLNYSWNDSEWMRQRKGPGSLDQPVSFYEVHLGSWKHKKSGYSYGYREIAEPLADHVERLGFTHVEFLPLMEHPYYGSWGYQVAGYYAPTHRFGTPHDLMYLVDYLHQRGIGVVFDWVPAHFATDPQGLVFFDGSTLFEYSDSRMRYHPDWGTYVFDYSKPGVKNFLIANALFWLQHYHIDGLRFDAVASMLYRDYSRSDWVPNEYGGRENLEAIDLLKQVNEVAYARFPEIMMIAEESTAWPGVSQPTFSGGLGFLYKWNMGWMHDTLRYMSQDPLNRKHHHNDLTFPLVYAFSEHYTLPLSHDEVVHGKGSLWGKMPGDSWQKAANLRLLFGHMIGHPGKKLLFMGSEFGQEKEWNHDKSLSWDLLEDPLHEGLMRWVQDAMHLYRNHPALWNDDPDGFQWIDLSDWEQSIICYRRKKNHHTLLFILNFTPEPRNNYRIGVPEETTWHERLNSDAAIYGGSGMGNFGAVEATPVPYHGHPASVVLTLPPLAVLILEREPAEPPAHT